MDFDLPLEILTIYSTNEGLGHDQVVKKSKWKDNFNFRIGNQRYSLYIKESATIPPRWSRVFDGYVDKGLLGVTSSAGAVLLTEVDGRTYALTFGISKQMLWPSSIEEGFGMRVVMNTVEKVRSIDKDTFDAIGGKTRTQASFDVTMGDFGFDAEKDLLKVVVGTPRGKVEEFGLKMAGVDALKVLIPFKLEMLPDLLRRFRSQYLLDTYKEQFGFVDQIRHITSESVKDKLNEVVAERLRERNFGSDIRMCIPDVLDLAEIPFFRYKHRPHSRENYSDISVETFLNTANSEGWNISSRLLKDRQVYKVDENDDAFPIGSVHKCLHADIDFEGNKYLLIGGKWYKVHDDFIQRLNEFYRRADRYHVDLPDFGDINWKPSASEKIYDEGVYNKSICMANSSFFLYDKKLIYPEKFEFCDLYTEAYEKKDLVHVKRAKNAQKLSHLFAQATVAAQAFMESSSIREKWNNQLPTRWKIDNWSDFPETSDYRVVFAIINETGNPLPFFARVNLQQAFIKLTLWRFKPVIKEIPVDRAWQLRSVVTRKSQSE